MNRLAEEALRGFHNGLAYGRVRMHRTRQIFNLGSELQCECRFADQVGCMRAYDLHS